MDVFRSYALEVVNNEIEQDVCLDFGEGKHLYTSKRALALCSKYFEILFKQPEYRNSTHIDIVSRLRPLSREAIWTLRIYILTDRFVVADSNHVTDILQELMVFGEYYLFVDLLNRCEHLLTHSFGTQEGRDSLTFAQVQLFPEMEEKLWLQQLLFIRWNIHLSNLKINKLDPEKMVEVYKNNKFFLSCANKQLIPVMEEFLAKK
jgi:hypothetical protein